MEYECVRIDRLDMEVEIDGELDDEPWQLAHFHPHNFQWSGGREVGALDDPNNFCPFWAAVATEEFLYIAWVAIDDVKKDDESTGCNAFNDDSQQIYVDFGNESQGYDQNDVQLIFHRGQNLNPDPDLLQVGWSSGGSCISSETVLNDDGQPVIRGLITELPENGWQGEIAIALQYESASAPGGKTWNVEPSDGTQVGIDLHTTDDDAGGSQGGGDDSSFIWAESGQGSNAWQTTAVLGKLTFREIRAVPRTRFVRGDCNGDTQVTGQVTDAVFMLNFNFLGGTAPPCMAACDANGDGSFIGQVTDAVYLLNFNFLGGPPPPPPFPGCGESNRPSDTALGCLDTMACR